MGFNTFLPFRTKSKMSYPPGSGWLDTGRQGENQSHPVKCQVLSVWFVYGAESVFSGVSVSFVTTRESKTKWIRLSWMYEWLWPPHFFSWLISFGYGSFPASVFVGFVFAVCCCHWPPLTLLARAALTARVQDFLSLSFLDTGFSLAEIQMSRGYGY